MKRFILSLILLPSILTATEFDRSEWRPTTSDLQKIPVTQTIPQDVEEVFEFVSQNVLLEAYSGALRGVRGALLAEAGNSLDQSLLLAQLLSDRGVDEIEIVSAEIDDAAISRLITKLETDQEYRRKALVNEGRSFERQLDLTESEEEQAIIQSAIERRETLLSRAKHLLEEHQRIVSPHLLENADEFVEKNEDARHDQWRGFLKTHYWVVAQIDGESVSLDPSASLAWGEQLTPATDSFAFPDLPEELLYRTRFQVRAYYHQNNEAWSELHLDFTSNSAALAGRPLFLVHPAKGDGFYGAGGFGAAVGGLFGGDGTKGWDHAPTFILDNEFLKGSLLKTKDRHPGNFLSPGKPLSVVAEVLEIEITHPSGEVTRVERPIFDLAGSYQRSDKPQGPWTLRSSGLAGDKEHQPRELQRLYVFAVQSGSVQSEYLEENFSPYEHPDSLSQFFGVNEAEEQTYESKLQALEDDYLQRVVLNEHDEVVGEVAIEDRDFEPAEFLPAQAQTIYRFHQFHDSIRAHLEGGQYFGYIAEPSVTSFFLGVNAQDENPEAPRLSAYLGVDLTHHRWHTTQSGDLASSGALSTLIEQLFAEELALIDPATEEFDLFTAHNSFALNEQRAGNWLWIKDENDPELEVFPPEVQFAIRLELQEGFVLVHAEAVSFYGKEHFAWFVFDRETGEAYDGTDVFLRQAITEKHITEAKDIIAKKDTACFYKQCLQAALGVAEGSLHVLRGRVSLDTATNLVEVLKDSKACAGKVKLKVRAPQKWKDHPNAFKKVKHMKSQAKRGKLKTPKKENYAGDRAKDPAEFGNPPNTPASTATHKRDWDHKSELACGGEHKKKNVWALDRHMNRSIGSVIGRACALLCEGTQITDIVLEWVKR